MKTAAYGSWQSLVTPEMLARGNASLAEPALRGEAIYWLESRPWDKGRSMLVRHHGEQKTDLLPSGFSARSRAQEYGGGAWTLAGRFAVFANDSDQAVYRIDLDQPASAPLALTPNDGRRYADFHFDSRRQRLLAVCEDHRAAAREAITSLVAISLEPAQDIEVLVEGDDFYAYPRLSADGSQLCWIAWNHPHMPWDSSKLVVARMDEAGHPQEPETLVNDAEVSVFQPGWSAEGELVFVADFGEFWNLYRWSAAHGIRALTELEAECGLPLWVFNQSTWAFTEDGLLCCVNQLGEWHLVKIHADRSLELFKLPFTHLSGLSGDGHQALVIAASPIESQTLLHLDSRALQFKRLHAASSMPLPVEAISRPNPVSFPTSDEQIAHAFFYPPHNPKFSGLADSKPPLVVLCHGGPTGATSSMLSLKVQFWTSRGFAVMDVNYRGSVGFGKNYRHSLRGSWGIADVADACRAAEYAVAQGWVNGDQLIIRGSSAGGFTVLAALAFGNTFNAGCCIYGIGDLLALAEETHKFESRYLDGLIAPWPEGRDEYLRRSPLLHHEAIDCPVIFFQGLRDKVVPPEQTRAMARALQQRGIATWFQTYAEEGHGFRMAETIVDSYLRELAFYAQVFGFTNTSGIELDLSREVV